VQRILCGKKGFQSLWKVEYACGMDWNKTSGVTNIGTFVFTVVAVVLMAWQILSPPSTQAPPATQGASYVMTWIVPGVLGFCILLAAVLHLVAANKTARSPSAAEKSSGTKKEKDRIAELEKELDARKWVNEIVEYQRKCLQRYVLVVSCEIDHTFFSQGKLYIEFTFKIVNYSMFYVSIPMPLEAVIEGPILFKGDRLSGTAKLVRNAVKNCPPYGRKSFTIRQWVNSDEGKDIPETLNTVGNRFDFSEAIIYIKADEFPDDKPAELNLSSGMQNAELENKIVELGNANKRLNEWLSLWRDRTSKIEELTRVLGMFYLAYNQLRQGTWLTTEAGNYLRGEFASALHRCFNDNKIVDEYLDNPCMYPVPVSEPKESLISKQEEWVDSHCSKLRAMIDEQRQGLSDYVHKDGSNA
jgi:hypothetical protein